MQGTSECQIPVFWGKGIISQLKRKYFVHILSNLTMQKCQQPPEYCAEQEKCVRIKLMIYLVSSFYSLQKFCHN